MFANIKSYEKMTSFKCDFKMFNR